MQSLPNVLLPQLQQQDQGQDQASNGAAGAGSKGGGGIPGEEGTSSFPFAAGRGLRPTQPPVFDETSRESPSRRSSPESPSLLGRRTLSRDNRADTQETALYRPESGSRAESPSQWPRASSQVPPQLVGGSAGANAGILISSPDPIAEYKTQMRSLLARSSFPRSLASVHPPTPRSQDSRHSSSTVSSITSQSSYASSYAYIFRRKKPDLRLLRKSSKPPQHLRPRASAVKKPVIIDAAQRIAGPRVVEDTGYVESTTKHITPPPMERPIALTLPELLKAEPPPKPLRKVQTLRFKSLITEGRQPTHTLKTAASRPVLSRADPPHPSPPHPLTTSTDAAPLQTGSRVLSLEHLHEYETIRRTARENRLNEQRSRSRGKRGSSHQSSKNSSRRDLRGMKKHNHDVTPQEQECQLVNESASSHGNSYFQTWIPEVTYCKEFVPLRTPISDEDREALDYFVPKSDPPNAQDPPQSSEQLQRSSTVGTTTSVVAKRKSSAFFKLFRRSIFKEKDDHGHHHKASSKQGSGKLPSNIASTESPEWVDVPLPPLTPGITLSSPADSKGEYTRSLVPELHSPSYFGRTRFLRDDSSKSLTPSPGHGSPGHTSPAEMKPDRATPPPLFSRPRHHKRSSSEALSPMSRPQKTSMLKHSSILEGEAFFSAPSQVRPGFVSTIPHSSESETASHNSVEDQPHRCETLKQRPSIAGLALPNLKSKQSHALTFQEPILRKKPSTWKSLVNGIRKVSSLGILASNRDSSSGEEVQRQTPLMKAKRSFAKLKLRPSLAAINVRNGKLVRISSRDSQLQSGDIDTEDDDKPSFSHQMSSPQQAPPQPRQPRPIRPDDLIVTNFEQTPFSKRYYDSIRAEQQAIRAFIDQTMEEDDEECDEVVLGFEQNVPDHLPKSPLCPLHPKHKSGGKAICPLHGRYKPPKRPPSPMHKMEIVFDTRENDVGGPSGATSAQAKLATGIDGTEAYLKRAAFT